MRTRWIVSAGLAAIGLVWIGQGLGVLGGSSFMVDDPSWAIAGCVFVLGGLVLGLATLKSRPGS